MALLVNMDEAKLQKLAEIVERSRHQNKQLEEDIATILHEAESTMHEQLIKEGREKLEAIKKKLHP